MVNFFFKPALVLLCCLFIIQTTFGQHFKSDTSFVSRAIAKANEIYAASTINASRLFNGVQYKKINLHSYDVGHPYFFSNDWLEGSIEYDGQLYQNISMLYDLINDKVIIDHPVSHFTIQLIDEKIKTFYIANHTFVRLVSNTSAIRTGFYDVLYDGKIKVYARRKKEMLTTLESTYAKSDFIDNSEFFIYKNGKYVAVKNKASLLKIFNDKKNALRKYITKNNLNFHKNREMAIAESARFYDEPEAQP